MQQHAFTSLLMDGLFTDMKIVAAAAAAAVAVANQFKFQEMQCLRYFTKQLAPKAIQMTNFNSSN